MNNQELIGTVAVGYGLSTDDLFKPTRKQPIAEARQMAMYLLFTQNGLKKIAISRLFNKSFPDVSYAINFIESLISVDKAAKGRHNKILKCILES